MIWGSRCTTGRSRPVRREQRVAGEHGAQVLGVEADGARRVARACAGRPAGCPPPRTRLASARSRSGRRSSYSCSQSIWSAGCSAISASVGRGHLDRRVDVVVVPVGADDRDDAAVTHRGQDRGGVVRGVDDQHLVRRRRPARRCCRRPTRRRRGAKVPEVTTFSTRGRPSEHHHRAQDLAAVHLVEGLLDVAEPDRLGHEARRGRSGPAGTGRSASGSRGWAGSRRTSWTSARRRDRRPRSAAARCVMSGVGHPDEHDGAGEVAGVERLLVGLGPPDRLDHDVGAEAAGELADAPRPRRRSRAVDGVGGAEAARPGELPVVDVDGDDRGGAGQPREPAIAALPTPPQPITATLSPRPTPPVLTAAPRPAITPQPSRPAARGRRGRVDLGALAGGDQRLLGEGADAEGGLTARCRRPGSSSGWRCGWRSSTRACPCGRPGTGRTPPAS